MRTFRLKYSIIDNNGNTIPVGEVLSVIQAMSFADGSYRIKAADSDGNEVLLVFDKEGEFDHEILEAAPKASVSVGNPVKPHSDRGNENNMDHKELAGKLIALAEKVLEQDGWWEPTSQDIEKAAVVMGWESAEHMGRELGFTLDEPDIAGLYWPVGEPTKTKPIGVSTTITFGSVINNRLFPTQLMGIVDTSGTVWISDEEMEKAL